MKIKTEIIHSIFIITCNGPSLDASLAQEFLNGMRGSIKKNRMDILLDISEVNFVDSTGLGSIIRSLAEIGGSGKLFLCGVNDRTLALLKMTHLNKTIRHEATREKALSTLLWDDNEGSDVTTIFKDPYFGKEEPVILDDLTDTQTTDATEINKKREAPKEERRKFRRIEQKQIMNSKLMIYCKNTSTGRRHSGTVLNISLGGLLMTTRSRLDIGDELLLEGRIGKWFKFKERAISRSSREKKYGLEFIDLSPATTDFLNMLPGSVKMIKSNKFFYDRPN